MDFSTGFSRGSLLSDLDQNLVVLGRYGAFLFHDFPNQSAKRLRVETGTRQLAAALTFEKPQPPNIKFAIHLRDPHHMNWAHT